jgi:hypothetical protein
VNSTKKDPRQYQGTSPNGYRTDANDDYAIMTVRLAEGDWLATTREFKAFGATESSALEKLARFMREAAESIAQLAEKRAALAPVHPTDPPHCGTCGEYGCAKHREATKET